MRQVIKVFEHSKLYLGDYQGVNFNENHLELLAKHATRNESKFFSLIRNGVKFKEYVGVIHVGNLTIEILPKADNKDVGNQSLEELAGEKEKWQKILIDMLRQSGYLKLESISESNLQLRTNSILELYVELFLKETEALLHQGLIKKYIPREENLNALKGKLSFNKHISKNIVHKEKFYVQHQPYQKDHLLNQILLKALKLIPEITNTSPLRDQAFRLLLDFPELKNIKVDESIFDKILFNRKSLPYKKAIDIARLLLLNLHPDFSSGRNHVLAILFDMNLLFEKYVLNQLKRTKNAEAWEVLGQKSAKFWENKSIRPDIVLKKKGQEEPTNIVMDTKWKVMLDSNPSDTDLKQMYAYNHYFNCNKSFLVYPKIHPIDSRPGKYASLKNFVDHGCQVIFVDVVDENGRLNKELGEEVFEVIDEN